MRRYGSVTKVSPHHTYLANVITCWLRVGSFVGSLCPSSPLLSFPSYITTPPYPIYLPISTAEETLTFRRCIFFFFFGISCLKYEFCIVFFFFFFVVASYYILLLLLLSFRSLSDNVQRFYVNDEKKMEGEKKVKSRPRKRVKRAKNVFLWFPHYSLVLRRAVPGTNKKTNIQPTKKKVEKKRNKRVFFIVPLIVPFGSASSGSTSERLTTEIRVCKLPRSSYM